jgi:hypothetical protein
MHFGMGLLPKSVENSDCQPKRTYPNSDESNDFARKHRSCKRTHRIEPQALTSALPLTEHSNPRHQQITESDWNPQPLHAMGTAANGTAARLSPTIAEWNHESGVPT